MGAEGKAVIHKNAPHLHRSTLRQLNYMQLVFFFLNNKKKKLWFAFNLLIFFPPFFLLHFHMPEQCERGRVEIIEDMEGSGLATGSFHGGVGDPEQIYNYFFFSRCS